MPAPPARRPNILVIFGDDVGIANLSAYSNGLMGYDAQHRPHRPRRHRSSTITASSRARPAGSVPHRPAWHPHGAH
jgi:arylsulfatase A-like enzyme